MTPLVSIVVPTLNQAAFIEQTLASIVGQNWPRLELIVIDGGSTDGTREIVERHPVQHFISERDSGQAEAINKGFRLARGDVLAWLNSDDYYLPLALARAVAALGDVTAPRLVYGACLHWHEQEDRVRLSRPGVVDREALRTGCHLLQPSAFWTRALWEKTGELNQDYHFVLDWDWWLRASAHTDFQRLEECLSVYRIHAQHKSGSGNPRRTQEILGFIERHAPAEWVAAFRAVAPHLETLSRAHASYRGREIWWHKLRHPALFLQHGARAEAAFWQLHM